MNIKCGEEMITRLRIDLLSSSYIPNPRNILIYNIFLKIVSIIQVTKINCITLL